MTEKLSEESIRAIIKDECHNILKEMNSKLNNSITNTHNELSDQINILNDSQSKISIKLDELNHMVNTDKAYVDRIQDLLNFQKKINDQINSHELRLTNATKSLKDACYKYDNIYLENLCIPGVIGEFCRFKTIKDYIEVIIFNEA